MTTAEGASFTAPSLAYTAHSLITRQSWQVQSEKNEYSPCQTQSCCSMFLFFSTASLHKYIPREIRIVYKWHILHTYNTVHISIITHPNIIVEQHAQPKHPMRQWRHPFSPIWVAAVWWEIHGQQTSKQHPPVPMGPSVHLHYSTIMVLAEI